MKLSLPPCAALVVSLSFATGCDDTAAPTRDVPAPRKDLSSEADDASWEDVAAERMEAAEDAVEESMTPPEDGSPDGDTPEVPDVVDVVDDGADADATEMDVRDAPDALDAAPPDVMDAAADSRDAAVADARDADADVRDSDVRDADVAEADAVDPRYRVDRPGDDCVQPTPDVAMDAEPPCSAGRTRACTCADGARGASLCTIDGRWEFCRCESGDGGAPGGMDAGIPVITQPRLLAPISGLRVTSQRPTLRWAPPIGAARSRVELCDDRACTRPLVTREVTTASWRPDAALRPGPVFWRVRAIDAGGVVTWTSATWLFGVRRRDTPVDSSYGVMRDHNGDGYDDLVGFVHGAYYDPESCFEGPQVYFGGADGLSLSRRRLLRPQDATSGLNFGESFAVGDINGDGLADIALTDPGQQTPGGGSYAPRVYVYLGDRSCLTRTWRSLSLAPTTLYGARVGVSIGDFNGDGFGDVVAGSVEGGLRIFAGGLDGPSDIAMHTTSLAGIRNQFVGDINGDGYNDVVAQHPRGQSSSNLPVYAFYGNPNGRFDFFVQTVQPSCSGILCNSYLGHAVRGGDLDEDGLSDVIIAESAEFHLYRGTRDGLRYAGGQSGSSENACDGYYCNFAGAISSPGDIDGDGHLEFAVGAQASPRNPMTGAAGPGQVFLYPHTALGAAPAYRVALSGVSSVSYWGYTSPLLDVNGDGFDDLVIAGRRSLPRTSGLYTDYVVLTVYRGTSGFSGVAAPTELVLPEVSDGPRLQ